ncbi:MarR family winged helix-turn-helix transcriptional regulator [Sphingobacterium spiritivorum]|uniref:Transcriptional regulator, MarR family n=1 Tax=Sphingobacterium spiritivorum ATCC 33861 TaxID=525373 RepID=D7VL33_SPHSI|nr:MarR family transcriptional regulator [Sphingobacterium spiritivorum]EFK58306.1 transcriptional regulator, MarR family [Sphingobacterium spiritivorum ATCC 33861]QQT37059.1 MarR family transcriptional regulator [Sphingobacterium spiritivorum]WQD33831.1 MarR family transcriptional regulator [Sphingobacterium spiritivorum]SUJ27423.1 Salmolysin [Sphingobacterium spiritivorum]
MSQDNTIDYFMKTGWQTVANKYNTIASQYGFTQAAGYILINIHKEGTPVSQIANLTGVKTTSLSRVLNNLETLGFIYREASDVDKRSVKVYLTELGKEKRKIAKDVVRSFNQYLEANISARERAQLIKTLIKINELAKDYQEEVQSNAADNIAAT